MDGTREQHIPEREPCSKQRVLDSEKALIKEKIKKMGPMKLLCLIIDKKHTQAATDLLSEVGIMRQTALLAHGTANQSWLEVLGLYDDEKVLMLGVVRESLVYAAYKLLYDEFCLQLHGTGIAFTTPLLAHSGVGTLFKIHEKHMHEMMEDPKLQAEMHKKLGKMREKAPEIRAEMHRRMEKIKEYEQMDSASKKDVEQHMPPGEHTLVITILNRGFSNEAIDAAREAGAKGATTLFGRGLAPEDVEQFMHIRVEPEKEVVLMVVERGICREVIENINKRTNLATHAHGICFALPLDSVFGLTEIEEQHKTDR